MEMLGCEAFFYLCTEQLNGLKANSSANLRLISYQCAKIKCILKKTQNPALFGLTNVTPKVFSFVFKNKQGKI